MVEGQGEFRLVTALFADVSGFTPLASRLDPEELLDVIDPIVSRLSSVVARFDGYVEKFAGDALLAVFGAPVAHEDDATRALFAALQMQRELETLRPSLPREAADLELHIGINSGRGVARVIGSDARVDYGVLGEVVILAQRLEAQAPPGSVYVSDSTRRLTEGRFELELVGELELKGVGQPVRTWRLVRERDERPLHEEALVGRDAELGVLTAVLDELQRGRGALVSVTGEPGVGKSRLCLEFRRQAELRGVPWLQARCLSYGAGLPYWPYAELLQRLDPGAAEEDPFLARLLGAAAPEIEGLEPAALRRGVEDAFAGWVERQTAALPLVLAVEDVHWLDEASLEVTIRLAHLCSDRPLLLCLIAREEGRPQVASAAAGLDGAHHAVQLGPLGTKDVGTLVGGLLGGPAPARLVSLVGERSGGNPFFVEELVRSLIDAGGLRHAGRRWQLQPSVDASSVPESLESVLSGRIDLLDPAQTALLQTASVIGRTVGLPLLRAVSGTEVGGEVDELVRRRFLDRVGPETVVFHHALVQDVAYSRLLRRRRRALHARTALEAETLYGGGDEAVELLARHLYLGGAGRKAVEYLQRAGERAARLYANEQAVVAFRQALERLAEVPEEEADEEWRVATASALEESLSAVLLLAARYSEAETILRPALHAEREPLRRARLWVALGEALAGAGRYDEEGEVYSRAERELAPTPARERDERWWQAWLDARSGKLGRAYWLDAQEEMSPLIDETRPMIERYGTALQQVDFFNAVCLFGLRRERYSPSAETVQAARAAFDAAMTAGREENHFLLGFCLLWHEDLDEAEHHLGRALAFAERTGDTLLRVRSIIYGAIAQRKRGQVDRVRAFLDPLDDDVTNLPEYEALLVANRAWIAWRKGDLARADELGHAALNLWNTLDQHSAPTAFQWTARWPLVAVTCEQGNLAAATEIARPMLNPTQQLLPDELAHALTRALDDGDARLLREAVALARDRGYS